MALAEKTVANMAKNEQVGGSRGPATWLVNHAMGRRAAGVVLCMTLPACLSLLWGGLQDVKDYWRLVAVRESITSYEFKDTRLDTLINNTRKMVRETRTTDRPDESVFWLCRPSQGHD